MSARFKTVML
jgi:hypothetical protein